MASSTRPAPPARPGKEPRRTYVLDTSVLLVGPARHRPLRGARGRPPRRGGHRAGGQAAPPRARATSPARRCGCSTTCASRHGRLDAPVPIGDDGGTLRVELNHTDPTLAAGRLPARATTTPASSRWPATSPTRAATSRSSARTCRCGSRPRPVGLEAEEYRAELAVESGWTGMAELDVTVEEMDHLYEYGRLDSVDGRRVPLPHRAGARSPRGSGLARVGARQAAAPRARRPRRVRPARPQCRAADRARPAAWTRTSASSASAAAPAPASPRSPCAPASRPSWSAASSARSSSSARSTPSAARSSATCPATPPRR